MGRFVLAAGIAMLVVAGCSKPTELASEANAKFDRRDPVVAPPAVGEEVDVTPVEPAPGSEEAEALPGEAGVAPADGTEAAPADTLDPDPLPVPSDTLQPPAELTPPAAEALPPVVDPAVPVPATPPAETAPAPVPAPN